MGSPEDEEGRSDDEGPQHEVEITRPFYLGIYPVTQAQWQAVMGNNPSWFSATGGGKDKVMGMNTDDFPVESVSWEDIPEFLEKVAALEQERGAGREYHLPTEAQWEYACRGGACYSTPFHFGDSLSSTQANFDGHYPYGGADQGPDLARTRKVGSYKPNSFGLYDMHGNVGGWCEDWFGEDYYKNSPRRDPQGPSRGSVRVIRGGCWDLNGGDCRAASRDWLAPSSRNVSMGFRVVAVPTE
jgi:formylglycine-generating enzyme required for sulfatase activity